MYNEKITIDGDAIMQKANESWQRTGKAHVIIEADGQGFIQFEGPALINIDPNAGEDPFNILNGIEITISSGSTKIMAKNCVAASYKDEKNNPLPPNTFRGWFNPTILTIQANAGSTPKYWRIALLNLITHFAPSEDTFLCPCPSQFTDNSQHIPFTYQKNPACIQPLNDYQNLCDGLKSGSVKTRVTALVTGQIVKLNAADPCEEIPDRIISLLSALTGNRVGIYCLELLDDDCNIIQSTYWRTDTPYFEQSHITIEEPLDIGQLLTNFIDLPHQEETLFWKALEEISNIGLEGRMLDETFRSAHIALELLVQYHDIKIDQLIKYLSHHVSQAVETIFADTESELKQLASSGIASNDVIYVNKIINRIRAPLGSEIKTGQTFKLLLERYNQPDAEILDNFYLSRNSTSGWTSVVNMYRNESAHENYISLSKGSRSTEELWALKNHLHDVALRIILTMLNYSGKYMSPILNQSEPVTTNWTNDLKLRLNELGIRKRSAKQPFSFEKHFAGHLGYSDPPTVAPAPLKKC